MGAALKHVEALTQFYVTGDVTMSLATDSRCLKNKSFN